MTIDWWTLGLQAINVLILMWLLARVFWRPVAAAIEKRQKVTKSLIEDAQATQAKADAALAEITKTREGLAAERDALLAKAAAQAEAMTKTAMAEARSKAESRIADAQRVKAREVAAARAASAAKSAELSVEIARRLLDRVATDDFQAAFLDLLLTSIAQLPHADKTALVGTSEGIDVLSATALKPAEEAKITAALEKALGETPQLNFITDAKLIAGIELRSTHFVLHNSWRADLDAILKDLRDAA